MSSFEKTLFAVFVVAQFRSRQKHGYLPLLVAHLNKVEPVAGIPQCCRFFNVADNIVRVILRRIAVDRIIDISNYFVQRGSTLRRSA